MSKDPIRREQALVELKKTHQAFQDCHAAIDLQTVHYLLSSLNPQVASVVTNARKPDRRTR